MKNDILRLATALHNACQKAYKENSCDGCPFKVGMGCNLYGHPAEWERTLQTAKGQRKLESKRTGGAR